MTTGRFPLRVGVVILPDRSWTEAQPRWRAADQMAFDHAWTYDHLTWRSFRDHTWHAAMPTLAAAALATERIRLGTLVASPNFRHPLTLAKELIALDDLSGRRITLGIGAGGSGWDATMLGHDAWSPRERADRFEELVRTTHQLLVSPVNTIHGRHYQGTEARTFPGCVRQPRVPFAVAATGPRGMALAAEHGQAWVTTGERHHEGPRRAPAQGAAVVRRCGHLCRRPRLRPRRALAPRRRALPDGPRHVRGDLLRVTTGRGRRARRGPWAVGTGLVRRM